MKVLVVVDMQKDFIDGSLGSEMAKAIVPNVIDEIRSFDGLVLATMDTHGTDYLETQEGLNLPVKHCIKGTDGWKLDFEIQSLIKTIPIEKPTFGSIGLAGKLMSLSKDEKIESIELVGLCTDICVISNAMVIKAALPETPIYVKASCCAGVTKESHERALLAMESCQIKII